MTLVNKVLLIYTGGTIGMNRNPRTGALEPFRFEHLLANVPELNDFDVEINTVLPRFQLREFRKIGILPSITQ